MATLLHVLYLGLFIFALSGCDASKSAQPSDTTADPSHSGNIDLGHTDLDLLVQLPSALSEETGGVTVERSLGADAADAARQAGLDVGMPAGGSVAALVSVTATGERSLQRDTLGLSLPVTVLPENLPPSASLHLVDTTTLAALPAAALPAAALPSAALPAAALPSALLTGQGFLATAKDFRPDKTDPLDEGTVALLATVLVHSGEETFHALCPLSRGTDTSDDAPTLHAACDLDGEFSSPRLDLLLITAPIRSLGEVSLDHTSPLLLRDAISRPKPTDGPPSWNDVATLEVFPRVTTLHLLEVSDDPSELLQVTSPQLPTYARLVNQYLVFDPPTDAAGTTSTITLRACDNGHPRRCSTSQVHLEIASVPPIQGTGLSTCHDDHSLIDCASLSPERRMHLGMTQKAPWELVEYDNQFLDRTTDHRWALGDPAGGLDLAAATAACSSLALEEPSAWRLPTRREVLGLATFGELDHLLLDALPAGTGITPPEVWTTSTYLGSASLVWTVRPTTGEVQAEDVSWQQGVALCILGDAPSQPRPLRPDATGELLLDPHTGLVWRSMPSTTTSGWSTALETCANSEHGGATDWRLPTIKELESLVVGEDPSSKWQLPLELLPVSERSSPPSNLWSSTTSTTAPGSAWTLNTGNGNLLPETKATDLAYFCVR